MPDVSPSFPNFFTPQPPIHDPGGKRRVPWPAGSKITATFSGPNDCYRTSLSEIWDENKPLAAFLMMNPSVAGVEYSDPTLFKTGKLARSWGFGGQLIGNYCAYRATDNKRLLEVDDPVGPTNIAALMCITNRALNSEGIIVVAHGQLPKKLRHIGPKTTLLIDRWQVPLHYLRMCADGVTPGHPLYLPDDSKPKRYTRAMLDRLEEFT